MPRFDDVAVGQEIPVRVETVDQERLLRYAGASGDFNRLHWDPEFAAEVSPTGGVIGHGMLSMGLVSAMVAEWAGGPDRVLTLSASFRAPCPVGADLRMGGQVIDVDPQERTVTLKVWAELADGARVVDRKGSRAVVRLD
jgi:acyl dehydratase